MKKLLGILVLGLLWCSSSNAESPYDFLEKDIEREYGYLYLDIHNKHGSKSLVIEKIKIWLSSCSNKSEEPDRIYGINGRVSPYSDRRFLVSSNFNYKKALCYNVWAKFYEPPKTNTTTTYTPKKKEKKKTGAQKLLEKIFNN